MAGDRLLFHLAGFREASDALREFGDAVAKRGLRRATFAGAEKIVAGIRATAPVLADPKRKPAGVPGLLRDAVTAFRRAGKPYEARYSVGFRKLQRKYAHTKRNVRMRRAGKRYTVDGPSFYAKFVERGSSTRRAYPFMRRGFDASAPPALEAIKQGLRDAVERERKAALRRSRKAERRRTSAPPPSGL